MVPNKDHVVGKIAFERIGVWTRQLGTPEYKKLVALGYSTYFPFHTVIYFAQLELVRVLEVIRLRNDFQPYHWTSWASRISEKMKKANEGHEGQTKARGWPKTKFQILFTFLGSLGVFYCMISIFLNFKVIKAKKAALLTGAAFFHLRKFILSKLVL